VNRAPHHGISVARRRSGLEENGTIFDGHGGGEAIKAPFKEIKAQIEETSSDDDKEKLQEHVAKLAGCFAEMKSGAETEGEMKETRARVQHAKHATLAAVEVGMMPGGGVALIRGLSDP